MFPLHYNWATDRRAVVQTNALSVVRS